MARQVLCGSEVVCATLVGCGAEVLDGLSFPLVVIDECTQATEPRAAIALARASDRVVLIGDQRQLAPTVTSDAARAGGLGVSLFERLLGVGVRASMLTVQYRMHPAIAAWPSRAFYGGLLEAGVSAVQRPLPPRWPSDHPVHFAHVDGRERRSRGGVSRFNAQEVRAVARAVERLLGRGEGAEGDADGEGERLRADELGVITPYAAQVSELRRALPSAVEVRTVDGFQGREKEVIIISAVRANARAELGFLVDPRRLNVAITRARRGLLVVGHAPTLRADPQWESFLRFVGSRWGQRAATQAATSDDDEAPAGVAPPPPGCNDYANDEEDAGTGRDAHANTVARDSVIDAAAL